MRHHDPRFPVRTKRGAITALWLAALLPFAVAAQSNPIVVENQQPGSGGWDIEWGGAGNDIAGQVKGYAGATSVNKGESINLHISVSPAQSYSIDVFRMGWYGGLGGRLMQHIGPLNGTPQATCPVNPTTGLIECAWPVSYTLNTQATWTSGVYLLVLTNAQNLKNYITFVVRDDARPAALLYQQPVTTYQAYNDYPYNESTGKSLYAFNSYGANTVGGSRAAVKVSFDRPYNGDGDANVWGHNILGVEHAFIRWLEKSGYDVAYSTDIDTHVNPGRLLNYRGIIVPGHDEYWTKEMRDGFEAARDGGTNLGFFSANISYTQIRLESSATGVPNRVVVCYREAAIDPTTDLTRKTVNWRDAPLNRPEQTLYGTMYTSIVAANGQGVHAPYRVQNSGHWVYAGTGFADGNTVTGLVGYEADRNHANEAQPPAVPGTFTILASSPFTGSNAPDTHHAIIYQASSGAWVFGAGTINWGFALDAWNPGGGNIVDTRIQRMTLNILNKFIEGTQTGFTLAATPAGQSVNAGESASYPVTVTPLAGFSGDVSLSVSGLPAGATAQFTPNPASSTSTLQVTTGAGTPSGTSVLTITGVNGSTTRTATVNLTVNAPDFALAVAPATRSIGPGQSTTYAVSISPSGGFTSDVNLSVSGLPAGATAEFSPNPSGSSSTLTVTTSAATPGGTSALVITGIAGALTRTMNASLTVTAPDFTLGATPASRSVIPGGAASYTISITPGGGFTGDVAFSVSGLPAGATAEFTPNPAAASTTLVVTTTAATPGGSSTLTITGVSGALTRTTTVGLTVTVPDFSLSVAPALRAVAPGSSTTYTVSISPSGGFTDSVDLSVSGLPSGTSAEFSPDPASSSSTMTVTTTAATPGGTSTLTITGVSGGLTRTTTASLNVTVQDFTLAIEPASRTVVRGDVATYGILLTKNNGFSGAVTYSLTGLPADTTYQVTPNPATGDTTLFVSAGGNAPGGSSVLTLTGVSGGITRTATTIFNVSAPVDFSAAISPASVSVIQGQTANYSIAITPIGGFSGQVSFAVTGLPAGAAATFTPNPGTTSSALAITTLATTPAGSYPLSINASSGALSHLLVATLVVTVPAPNVITVTAPNTAVSWRATTVQNITYTHNLGAAQPVIIEVSRDGGGSWSPVASVNTTGATSGTYAWTVTSPPTTQARIRVSSATTPTVNDISNVNFTITIPSVTMNLPNTAVSWQAGSTQNVRVNHTLASGQPIALELSRDGGTSWAPITTVNTTTSTSVTYAWPVTGPATTTARIRATWTADTSVTDITDVNFSITPRTRVTAPNTAVTWTAGTTRNVTWSHNLGLGGLVDIDFSADNGASWTRIASNVASTAATTGTVALEMPTVTTQARIRITPAGTADLTLGDMSDVSFSVPAPTLTVSAPNTNVAWAVGTTQAIRWNHNLGTLESMRIEIARDGVNYSETVLASVVNSGSTSSTYNWVVTGPVTSTARIRVTWLDNTAITDISNVTFRIQ